MARSFVSSIVIAVALLVVECVPAFAQNNVLDLRPADINSDGDVTYGLFIYNRIFSDGKIMFEALHLRIPSLGVFDDYNEVSVGGGIRLFKTGGLRLYGMAHYAVATDDARFFQPGVIMQFASGRWAAS